ncbi:MAG: sugar phosphate nucleotidyltransferase [Bacteroidota bacterium]
MRIIVPMAGRGSRLRPHTLTIPKPLLPVAGKPIVQRLVEDIAEIYAKPIDEIVFIIGDFGEQVEQDLLQVAEDLGSKGRIAYQDKPLGTAHAIHCAGDSLNDEIIIAFADTLFRADFKLDQSKDGVIWVKQVEDPRAFGVVNLDESGIITEMVEKPENPQSNLAIIGIYYIKDGANLKKKIEHLLDNDIKSKGEYQLTDALDAIRAEGGKLAAGEVSDWMDCGNKDNLLDTTRSILDYDHADGRLKRPESLNTENAVIIEPCKFGENVTLKNCVIGPYVSIGDNSRVESSVISETILQTQAKVHGRVLTRSIVSNQATAERLPESINLGDFSAD